MTQTERDELEQTEDSATHIHNIGEIIDRLGDEDIMRWWRGDGDNPEALDPHPEDEILHIGYSLTAGGAPTEETGV